MPNWCKNSLSVKGEKQEVKRFYEKGLETSPGRNNGTWNLYPYYPYPGEWNYDWCCKNWGTKWNILMDEYDEAKIADEKFVAAFHSAWTPPVEWLKKVQKDYPKLQFELTYNENGMQYKGRAYTVCNEDSVVIIDQELPWINPYCGKVRFYDIKWDSTRDNLPIETVLEVYEIETDFDEEGAELLSNEYGSCVYSFSYEIIHRNEDYL
jgi:hypothetical protein